MSADKKNKIIVFFTITIFFALFSYFSYNRIFIKDKNVANNQEIHRGKGWLNNTSNYSGSEMSFTIENSESISFQYSSDSKADQGVEIVINDEIYTLHSPNINNQNLKIKLDNEKSNQVLIRHFCTYFYEPCNLNLESISVDKSAKILPYQAHNKTLSILGDSISTIYGKDNYSFSLTRTLGYELHNASILGSSLSKVEGINNAIKRYETDLKQFKSEVIIIFLGSNDVANNVPLADFERDYKKIIEDIKSWNPEARIFLVEILPRKDIRSNIIDTYNEVIKKISSDENVLFIDTSDLLTEMDFSDDIHPSIQSQPKISDRFREEIEKAILN